MIARDLQTFARVTAGTLHGEDTTFGPVQTDSRAIEANAPPLGSHTVRSG